MGISGNSPLNGSEGPHPIHQAVQQPIGLNQTRAVGKPSHISGLTFVSNPTAASSIVSPWSSTRMIVVGQSKHRLPSTRPPRGGRLQLRSLKDLNNVVQRRIR
jgi:hypothetical protein